MSLGNVKAKIMKQGIYKHDKHHNSRRFTVLRYSSKRSLVLRNNCYES